MHRLPRPLTLPALRGMMKDQRYWNRNHPEHIDWVKLVTQGFEKLFPGSLKRDATGRQIDPMPIRIREDRDNFPGLPARPLEPINPIMPTPLPYSPGEFKPHPLPMPAQPYNPRWPKVDQGAVPFSSASEQARTANPVSRDGVAGPGGGQVHVRSYIRYVNGQPVQVEEHWRSVAPGHGRNKAGPAAKDDPLQSLISLLSQIAAMAGVPPALINAIGQALPMLNMVGGVLGNALGNALDGLGAGATDGNGETITGLSAGDTIPQDSPPNLFEMPLPSEGGGEGQGGPVQMAEARTVLPGVKPTEETSLPGAKPPAPPLPAPQSDPSLPPPENSKDIYRPPPTDTMPPDLPIPTQDQKKDILSFSKDVAQIPGITALQGFMLTETFVAEGGKFNDGSLKAGIGETALELAKENLGHEWISVPGLSSVTDPSKLDDGQTAYVYYGYFGDLMNEKGTIRTLEKMNDARSAAAYINTLFTNGTSHQLNEGTSHYKSCVVLQGGEYILTTATNTVINGLTPEKLRELNLQTIPFGTRKEQSIKTFEAYTTLSNAGYGDLLRNAVAAERLKGTPPELVRPEHINHFRYNSK